MLPITASFLTLLPLVASFSSTPGCKSNPIYNGTVKLSVSRPEGEREFYLHVPQGFSNNQSIPLILVFHGWLVDSCENIASCKTGDCDLTEESDQLGFILVRACGYRRSWNAGNCCSPANELHLDDNAFALAIISLLSATLCIDTTKIWSAGFSNGAMLSEVFACNQWDTFSAVASVSGVVEISPGGMSGEQKCNDTYSKGPRSISVLNVHGTADLIVPWCGSIFDGYPSIPFDFWTWSQRNQCHGGPVQTFSQGHYSNQVYQNCTGGSQIELVKNEGGGHEWPQDSTFDTTTYILSFFQRVSGWKPWAPIVQSLQFNDPAATHSEDNSKPFDCDLKA